MPRALTLLALLLFLRPATAADAPPRVFLSDPAALAKAKIQINGDLKPALDRLKADADKALQAKPASVMDKKLTPASGDKHDYMSVGPYWWPDPSKPDGLPYINKDGQTNPARGNADTDAGAMGRTVNAATTLAQAYYFTGDDRYAAHAAKLLRTWFLDPATRMNPNLNYAQAIPGRVTGRGIGIIDTVNFVPLVDAIGLLHGSKDWTANDQNGMVAWFDAYLTWLQTSRNGLDEAKAKNNHGTWYDAQICAFALFVNKPELARQTAESAKAKRIDVQIEPDGSMPLEMKRTNSLSYTFYNLTAFYNLARLAEHVGVDLWTYQSADGRGLRKATDYLAPYLDAAKPWPGQQISKKGRPDLPTLLRRAAIAFKEPAYEDAIARHAADAFAPNRARLMFHR
jgi:hypothetical protein